MISEKPKLAENGQPKKSQNGVERRQDKSKPVDNSDESTSETESDSGDEDEWQDVNENDDQEDKLIFCSLVDQSEKFDNALDMLSACKKQTGFDFIETRDRLDLDFEGCVRLINFVRSKCLTKAPLPDPITDAHINGEDKEKLMIPVLEDDAFIMALDDLPRKTKDATCNSQENEMLREALESLQAEFQAYKNQVTSYLAKHVPLIDGDADASDEPSLKTILAREQAKQNSNEWNYFDSYGKIGIHELMLKDRVRTEAYRDFIYENKHLFKGKVVLDVGCGTGILSMFAAKAGAARVFAVDNSSDIVRAARANIKQNQLDSVITVIEGMMEEVTLPLGEGRHGVDIIVSEWMGYCLTYEAMLPSVLYARDRYLLPGGLIVPSHATLRLAPVHDSQCLNEEDIAWWHDVYGFDLSQTPALLDPPVSALKENGSDQQSVIRHAVTTVLDKEELAGSSACFRILDLYTIRAEELEFESDFTTLITHSSPGNEATAESKSASSGPIELQGWAIWFDIFFAPSRDTADAVTPADLPEVWKNGGNIKAGVRVAFTTGPWGQPTHWKQGLFPFRSFNEPADSGTSTSATAVAEGDVLAGKVKFSHAPNDKRSLFVEIRWGIEGQPLKSDTKWTLD